MEKLIRFAGSFGRAAMVALTLGAIASMPHDAHAQRRPAAAAASAEEAVAPSAEGVVNIQTASADELQRLPGIGPSKAQAIIQFRERTPFRRVEDILRVRGIGRATFRRLRSMLSVSGPTTLSTEVHMPRVARAEADDTGEGSEP